MSRIGPRPAATFAAVLACVAATVILIAITLAGHIDPARAVPFFALWTAAPFVAAVGTRLRSRGSALTLVLLGLIAEITSYISMGGGFVYALVCGPLLLIALVATAGRRMG
jgi:hypothetical protein